MEHTQAQLILANNAYTCKIIKTVTCFKLYQVNKKEINFKKKTVNIGKVQSKPSVFTAPSFMEPVKVSILRMLLEPFRTTEGKHSFFSN